MFDFRLQVFKTVAKRLNFTKAAQELSITQPAVTKHVKEIEQYFQIKLFDRNGTKIKLTPAGEMLLQYSEQIFDIYKNLEIDLNALASKHGGRLKIGASTTVAQYVLPPVIAAFHQKFKDINITLDTGNTEKIEQSLLDGKIDLGIIEGQSKAAGLKYSPFLKDEIVLITNSRSPLSRKPAITVDQLKEIPLLMREPGSGTLEVIHYALKEKGLSSSNLRMEMQLSNTESIKLYLLNSPCASFLSIHSVLKELKTGEMSIIDIQDLTIERYFNFIQAQGQSNNLVELFIKFTSRYNYR
ncbi:LysR substrate-binding domain-containing protein [Fulvivirga sediminis]|uniref:LysR family transcriptional regulator n=1 Tax=Fulvivirga sediminis TaxID=2803949 RepID=A0A937K0J3_9BACT|nr:LysR substrate-binding domain-containing protein [Fulvivirga sediminis]MBL3656365.1 LysR family transcriptional regulator [Fulvivirga sediminis]